MLLETRTDVRTSDLTTLGDFALRVRGKLVPSPATRKARALMAFLVINRGAGAARERLIELFWPHIEPDRARDSLSTALHSIRRSLRTAGLDVNAFLLATKAIVRWMADTEVDSEELARLAAREDPLALQEALRLYQGDFLEGDYDEWVVVERERLAVLYETVLARAVRTSNDTVAARRLIARSTYDEQAYAAVIEEELRAGRRSLAASWVERCRTELSEVGVEPSATFEARFGSIEHVAPLITDELTLPFAGRTMELAWLAARFADVISGRGSFTLVRGEAGIGKSTLLSRASRLSKQYGLEVLAVACSDEASGTFGPWRKVFREVGSGESLDAFVRMHPGDAATAVADSIARSFTKSSVLIVDDAHELSGEALDVFMALSRTIVRKHAIVAATRPEGATPIHSRLSDLPLEELPINGLDRNDLRSALTQTLGTEQDEVLDTLYDRSAGHPLFFVGLLNSLVSGGALMRDGAHWLLAKPIDSDIELPDTLRRFIEIRLRERGEVARAVACALALEPHASADDLAAVLALDTSVTLDALDDLLALGLIVQPISGAPFSFTHDLVREVAAIGLNVGRRTSMHRVYAQRLTTNAQRDTSLRLARHLRAAGEPLAAARAYLNSAQEALELNAAQDAIERCDAGVAMGERSERTPSQGILIAMLHRTAARALVATGDAVAALTRARQAVTLANAGADAAESIRTTLDLAAIEGVIGSAAEQKSDAIAAIQKARSYDDAALEAEALIHQANSARKLGSGQEALLACRSAYALGRRCDRSDLATAAIEELLYAQTTWWFFDDALETARTGLDLARRAGPLAEAAFRQARCALWYLLERFSEAESELAAALRLATESIVARQESVVASVRAQPHLRFAGYCMAARIAIEQKRWNQALELADKAGAITTVDALPYYKEALALVRADALLGRRVAGDSERARDLIDPLGESEFGPKSMTWSAGIELARARLGVQLGRPGTHECLRRVIDTLEECAHQTPLDCDRAFARLAGSADMLGDEAVARRARSRSTYYRRGRMALAGSAWGGAER